MIAIVLFFAGKQVDTICICMCGFFLQCFARLQPLASAARCGPHHPHSPRYTPCSYLTLNTNKSYDLAKKLCNASSWIGFKFRRRWSTMLQTIHEELSHHEVQGANATALNHVTWRTTTLTVAYTTPICATVENVIVRNHLPVSKNILTIKPASKVSVISTRRTNRLELINPVSYVACI